MEILEVKMVLNDSIVSIPENFSFVFLCFRLISRLD